MHFALVLDIKATGVRKTEIETHIWDTILSKYKRAKRLNGNMIVAQISSDTDWNEILSKMAEYVKEQKETIHFIMTPAMTGGRYNGILPKDNWDFINEITG
jgi:hypothetical protein